MSDDDDGGQLTTRTRSRSQQPPRSRAQSRDGDPAAKPAPDIRRRLKFGSAALAVVLLLALGINTVPVLRTAWHQSFTRMSTPSPAIYFTGNPTVNGAVLDVPIALDAHATSASTFTLQAWLVTGAGKPGPVLSAKVTSQGGVVKTVLDVQLPVDPEVVWVSLVGQSQTLHYRIAGDPIPTTTAH